MLSKKKGGNRKTNRKTGGKTKLSSQLCGELALKNVRKSAKDYLIYFLTLAFAVCMFYTFNSLGTQYKTIGLADTFQYLSFSTSILAVFSLFICAIIGFLVVYANRFLLRRRKKEIGVYYTLGMSQADLNSLLMKETLYIGAGSLAIGLIMGIFVSQMLSMITARLIGVGLSSYHFMVSYQAILAAIFFFGLMFVFVHKWNIRELRKMQLIELLNSGRKNEESLGAHKKTGFWILAVSLLLMAAGHGWTWFYSGQSLFGTIVLGSLFVMAGVFLFFTVLPELAGRVWRKKENWYYHRLNLFVAGQFSSRTKSSGLLMGVISLLLLSSLMISSLGMSIGGYLVKDIEFMAPYDISLLKWEEPGREKGSDADASVDLQEELENSGFPLREYAKDAEAVRIFRGEQGTEPFFLNDSDPEEIKGQNFSDTVMMMGVDDFNRLRSLQGLSPVRLEEQEYGIFYNAAEAEEQLEDFQKNPKPWIQGGRTLHLADQGIYRISLYNQNVLMNQGAVIVPQSLTEGLEPELEICNLQFSGNAQEKYERFLKEGMDLLPNQFTFYTKQEVLLSVTSTNLLFTYIGVYLGITLLITAGAVLALQQLSQSTDNEKRYQLLKQMGARKKDREHSVKLQVSVYFGFPFAMAALQTLLLAGNINRSLSRMLSLHLWGTVALCIACVTVLYGLYFVTTYLGSKRILDL